MILLMGMPGSGKGTQGKMLADQHNITGDMRKKMMAGELLNDQEIITIIDKVFTTIDDSGEVLLDGFPRTIPQAEWLLEQVKNGRFKLNGAIHLLASREAVKARLMNRGRLDDKESVIEARFDEYEKLTHPLLKWFGENGVDVIDVNAERAVEDVNTDLIQYLDSHK
jgi:adenylate kinase